MIAIEIPKILCRKCYSPYVYMREDNNFIFTHEVKLITGIDCEDNGRQFVRPVEQFYVGIFND